MQCSLIMVGKKGRDGWESGEKKKQVGYTILTCGPPLFPMYRHYNTFCNE